MRHSVWSRWIEGRRRLWRGWGGIKRLCMCDRYAEEGHPSGHEKPRQRHPLKSRRLHRGLLRAGVATADTHSALPLAAAFRSLWPWPGCFTQFGHVGVGSGVYFWWSREKWCWCDVGANSDIEQVEYFWALLSEQRAAVREKLDRLNAALARSERGGHLSSVRRKRLLIRAMENDIRTIDRMLYALGNRLSASSNPLPHGG